MRWVLNTTGTITVVSSLGVFLSGYTTAAVIMLVAGTMMLAFGMRERK